MSDKIVNHFVLADGSTAKYDAGALLNLDDTVSLAGYAPDAKEVGDRLTDVENFVYATLSDTELDITYTFANETDGYFINNGGVKSANTSYSMSDTIDVVKGQKIKLTAQGYNQSVAMISKYDTGTNTYTPLVLSTDSTVRDYTYTVTENMTIVLSYRKSSDHSCNIWYSMNEVVDELNVLSEQAIRRNYTGYFDFTDVVDGYFLTDQGVVSTHSGYAITKPKALPTGTVVNLTATGYGNTTTMIAQYKEGTYIPLVISATGVTQYTYTLTTPMEIVVCYRKASTHNGSFTFNFDPAEVVEKIGNIAEETLDYAYLFHDYAGVGDSLMSGEIWYTANDHTAVYESSWLSNLARKVGATCTHYSTGGMTTKAWIEDFGGYKTALVNAATPAEAYFIGLGTNDKNQSVYPLGTINDAAGYASFVGYYKEIINTIHTKAPDAPIFCMSMYDFLAASVPYSQMVSDISDLYSYCYFLDFANNTDHTPKTDNIYANNSHFTSIGYLYASKVIMKLIDSVVIDNANDFKYIGV